MPEFVHIKPLNRKESPEQNREMSQEEFEAALKELERLELGHIYLAALAREKGSNSWRGFHVGCCVATIDKDSKTIEPHTGANLKEAEGPKKEGDTCAEPDAIREALKTRFDQIVGITTVSDKVSTEDHNPLNHDVLHPCDSCKALYRDLLAQGKLRPETRLTMIKDPGKKGVDLSTIEGYSQFIANYNYDKIKRSTIGEILALEKNPSE